MDHKDITSGGSPALPAADGIRGFACLWVLVVHNIAIIFPSTFPGLAGCGKIGVWLFFVLSAYLLTCKLRVTGLSWCALGSYGWGRFWRIVPPFAAALLLYRFAATAGIDSSGDLVDALMLRKGYAHLWTIPVEFKFYFILPIFVAGFAWLARSGGLRTVVLGGIALIVLHQVVFPFWQLGDNSIETRWYLSSFLVGIVAAFLPRLHRPVAATIWGVAILASVVLLMPVVRHALFGIEVSRYLMNKYLLLSPLWAIFIVTQADGVGWIGRILRGRVMSALGHWSYSIYLVHWLFALKAREIAADHMIAVIISMVLAVFVGYCFYRTIERPSAFCRGKFWPKARPVSGPASPGS